MDSSKNRSIFMSITVINIVIFIISFGGYNWFGELLGNSYLYTLEGHQYYRLVSCMFLHYGLFHLVGNTISLFVIDNITLGFVNKRDKYFIYIITGVLSSLASAKVNMIFNRHIISAGASGAICGLIGMYVAILHGNRKSMKSSILYLLIPLLIIGIRPGVDNIAHIAGLVCGFIIYKLAYNK